jgi:hypothetical protein
MPPGARGRVILPMTQTAQLTSVRLTPYFTPGRTPAFQTGGVGAVSLSAVDLRTPGSNRRDVNRPVPSYW